MAEAVAGLATAASALQLADVGLRWGKEIYNLLSDIKHAPQEVHNLRNTVDDVNSVIRNLSRYIAEFNQSASTRAEHNVLPEAVTRAVQGFHEQLATLKGLLPTESVQQKIRWGLDKKRKVKEVTENLGRRKTTVLLALEIDGRWADIKKRDDIRNLADTLTATSQAARESHASSFNAVNSELATIRGSGQRIEASQAQSHRVLQGIRDHTSSLGTVTSELGTIRGSAHRIEASQAQAHDLIQGIGDRLPLADGAIHDKLDSLISIFTGFQLSPEQSLSTTSAYNVGSEETLGRVFRAELRRVLIPALDQSLGSFSGKDAVLRDVRRTDDLVSGKMSEAVMFQKPAACEKGQTQPPLATLACTKSIGASKSTSSSGASTPGHTATPESDPDPFKPLDQSLRRRAPVKLLDRTWRIRCRIGYLVTRFQRFRRRDDILGHNPFFRISAMFYPPSRFMTLPGLSAYFTDEPDQRGHYQLCPLLTTFPIISSDAPVFQSITSDNVEAVRNLFVAGLASPRDQDGEGMSLLICASLFASLDMCRFLLEAGADPATSDGFILGTFQYSKFLATYNTITIRADSDVKTHNKNLESRLAKRIEVTNMLWNASTDALRGGPGNFLTHAVLPHYREAIAVFFKGLQFEIRQFFLEDFCSSRPPVPQSGSSFIFILELHLSCGIDPNAELNGFLPLQGALIALFFAETDDEDREANISPFYGIITLLLRKGADPYVTVRRGFLCEDNATISIQAAALGLLEKWEVALAESGYDPKEVYAESERGRKEEKLFQGAKRSPVDMTELLPQPQRLTLRSGHVFEEE